MKPKYYLEPSEYTEVIKRTPLVAIDIVVICNGNMLLGKRINRPAQGTYFVPGGRICKGEKFDDAFLRISYDEIGVPISRDDCQFLGIYDHMYSTSANDVSVPTHYIVLGYRIDLKYGDLDHAKLASQHSDVKYLSLTDVLTNDEVHTNTKVYAHQLITDFGYGGIRPDL